MIPALFEEIQKHLLEDATPSRYLEQASKTEAFCVPPFSMLLRLKKTEQSPVHHPEGNVWNHTMLVVDEAAARRGESKTPAALMWAALLHDIGKPDTTKVRRGKITAYGHDTMGAGLAERFLNACTADEAFIRSVRVLVRYHMHMLYVLKNLPFQDLPGLKREADINELALFCLCDRLGRLNPDHAEEERNRQTFLQKLIATQ